MKFVTFESYEEAEYFNTVAGKECWVGITDVVTEGTFMQVSGVIAPNLPWSVGQPSNDNNEDCVVSGYLGGFNDDNCHQLRRFACETSLILTQFGKKITKGH